MYISCALLIAMLSEELIEKHHINTNPTYLVTLYEFLCIDGVVAESIERWSQIIIYLVNEHVLISVLRCHASICGRPPRWSPLNDRLHGILQSKALHRQPVPTPDRTP
jgi:hypothetical protein